MSFHANRDRVGCLRASRALSLEAVRCTNRLMDGDELGIADLDRLHARLADLGRQITPDDDQPPSPFPVDWSRVWRWNATVHA